MSRRLRDPESAAAIFLLTALTFVALALAGGFFLGRATKSSTSITVSARTMLPFDFDIFPWSNSNHPFARTDRGTGIPAAIKNAGQ